MTNPRPKKQALEDFYRTSYLSFHTPERGFDLSEHRRIAQQRVDLLRQFLDPSKHLKVLEVGTGMGQFQLGSRDRTSWDVSGIEPGEYQHRYTKETLGMDVQNVFLEDFQAECTYDCVASFHVLEHSAFPTAFLQKTRTLLSNGGILFLEVPNLERPEVSLDDFFQLPHLYNFTALTLRNYLTKTGFRALHWTDKTGRMSVVARAIEPGENSTFQPEKFDINQLERKLLMHQRLYRLAQFLPKIPLLQK